MNKITISDRSLRSVLVLAMVWLFSGCGGDDVPLSILEWRESPGDIRWIEHVSDGEFYMMTYKRESLGERRRLYTLSRYLDQELVWSVESAFPSDRNVQVVMGASGDDERLIAVQYRSGINVQVLTYNESGEPQANVSYQTANNTKLIIDDSGSSLFLQEISDDAVVVAELVGNEFLERWQFSGTFTWSRLQAVANGWIFRPTGTQVMLLNNEWETLWSYETPAEHYFYNVFASASDVIFGVKEPEPALYFVNRGNGSATKIVLDSFYKLLALDETGLPLLQATIQDNSLQKIDSLGNLVFESATLYDYNDVQTVEVMPSGQIYVLSQFIENYYSGNSYVTEYTPRIDVLGTDGSLINSYTALADRFSTVIGCVEWCTVTTLQEGYRITKMFKDVDDDIYVYGVQPREFYGKVDLAKFDVPEM